MHESSGARAFSKPHTNSATRPISKAHGISKALVVAVASLLLACGCTNIDRNQQVTKSGGVSTPSADSPSIPERSKTPVLPPAEGPRITFDREQIDLGSVEEGIEIERKFELSNTGSKPLKIYAAYASCGCTVPTLEMRTLKPGGKTDLKVLIDTAMKQDQVTKTVNVSSNDPDRPIVALALSMHVKNRHTGLSSDGKAKIFTDEKCSSCHASAGVGLFGKELYEADCAMCHGAGAQGGIGPCLVAGDYNNAAFKDYIRKTIEYGSKRHQSMPGFLVDAGGPLAKEQVDSIMTYLAELSKKK